MRREFRKRALAAVGLAVLWAVCSLFACRVFALAAKPEQMETYDDSRELVTVAFVTLQQVTDVPQALVSGWREECREWIPEEREFTGGFLLDGRNYTVTAYNTLHVWREGDFSGYLYDLSVLDETGDCIQQFSFGAECKEALFWFDDLNFDGYPDLVIHYFPWGKNRINYYRLYLWKEEEGCFSLEPISLCNEYEVVEDKKLFVTGYADMFEQSFAACRISENGEIVELRFLYKDNRSESMRIEDSTTGEILFEGPISPEEADKPVEDTCYYTEIFLGSSLQ